MISGALLLMGVAFVFNMIISVVFSKIVALKSMPDRRALWTVLPGYVAVTGLMAAMLNEISNPFFAPFVSAPRGLILYWWYRREFRIAWVDDTEDLPEGVTLQNNDWQVGVAVIILLFTIGLFRYLF